LITRKDIAKYAGVSKTTVTRVVNNQGSVSEKNIEKVNQAIKTMEYYPNMVARGLKTKKSYQILFHATELLNPFFVEIYTGMNEIARQYGYHIVVSSHYDTNTVRQRQYDGVILPYIPLERPLDEYINLGVRLVPIDYTNDVLKIPHIKVDITGGIMQALDYLYECGHRRIALITLLFENDQRLSAYKKWLEIRGLLFQSNLIYDTQANGKTNYDQGYNIGILIAENGLDATAILAFNDTMAIGMLAAFNRKGIRVPKDISLVGFDNITQAKYTNPPLTTVDSFLYQIGKECAQMLISEIDGEIVNTKVIKTELIIRDSVARIYNR
jgi:LacI family repressor for deo operon, udp, cdd, tsx, nupC, and nupG